ncbi:MAG: ZIP family metal transporter [Candidatus Methylarchaceae archaeon HK02M1]|nr:ZIP family metal transporter [Candidatus Methylarchaceae archaeon HK02M1]
MTIELIQLGLLASLIAGAATGIGGLPVFFIKDISHRTLDTMLGFAAGVMLAATAFSLLIPAIELGGVLVTLVGFLAGGVFVYLLDRYVPHTHLIKGPEGPSSSLSRVSLLILAITIHNFPEGLAVGLTFGGGDISAGIVIATAIGLQNIPEGSAVAFPLIREGFRRRKALWYATLTGLVEPVGGLIGVAVVALARPLLPSSLAFAAGAMAFVVSHEMIPESHRKGHENEATFGFILGFSVMMFLDTIFG